MQVIYNISLTRKECFIVNYFILKVKSELIVSENVFVDETCNKLCQKNNNFKKIALIFIGKTVCNYLYKQLKE